MTHPNILVVGLVQLADVNDVNTEALTRDHVRTQDLQKRFNLVFSMAPYTGDKQVNTHRHVRSRLGKSGAKALIDLMNKHHDGKSIHRICLEYVRLPADYYRPFIIGSANTIESKAGHVLTQFMEVLNNKPVVVCCSLPGTPAMADGPQLSGIIKRFLAAFSTLQHHKIRCTWQGSGLKHI